MTKALEGIFGSATIGYIVIGIALVVIIGIIVYIKNRNAEDIDEVVTVANEVSTPVSAPAISPAVAPKPYNGLELYKTGYKTAASIMAIVSHESGIPLNRLQFTSIKLDDKLELNDVDDKTAATIMAVVSHQSGIPLDRLVFKSIKQINN